MERFRERGEAADLLYNIERYAEAERAYLEIYEEMTRSGVVDMRVAAKVALGLLLTWIESGQIERAHALWTSSPVDDLGEGIYAIEHGQTTRQDQIAYRVVSAFFHSLSAEDPAQATEAVNLLMSSVCEHARTHDPPMLPLAIQDWKQFLLSLGAPLDRVSAEEARLGRSIPLDGVDFPPPSPWALD
jgi:hypothetical protein